MEQILEDVEHLGGDCTMDHQCAGAGHRAEVPVGDFDFAQIGRRDGTALMPCAGVLCRTFTKNSAE